MDIWEFGLKKIFLIEDMKNEFGFGKAGYWIWVLYDEFIQIYIIETKST